ncbi:hypothetical protein BS17DRAFT_820532 [Gyrodon lividus]|nr:hypothetical protein BS17DRAFT_820532 [Gyrodon lividus]
MSHTDTSLDWAAYDTAQGNLLSGIEYQHLLANVGVRANWIRLLDAVGQWYGMAVRVKPNTRRKAVESSEHSDLVNGTAGCGLKHHQGVDEDPDAEGVLDDDDADNPPIDKGKGKGKWKGKGKGKEKEKEKDKEQEKRERQREKAEAREREREKAEKKERKKKEKAEEKERRQKEAEAEEKERQKELRREQKRQKRRQKLEAEERRRMEAEAAADAQAAANAAAESKEEEEQKEEKEEEQKEEEEEEEEEEEKKKKEEESELRENEEHVGDGMDMPSGMLVDPEGDLTMQGSAPTPIPSPVMRRAGVSVDPLDFTTSLDLMTLDNDSIIEGRDSDGISPPPDSRLEHDSEREAMPTNRPPASRGRGRPKGSRNVKVAVTHVQMQLRQRSKQAELASIGEDIPGRGQEKHSVRLEGTLPTKRRASKKRTVSTQSPVEPEVSTLVEVERNSYQDAKHTFRTVTLTISPKKRQNVVAPKVSGGTDTLPTVTAEPRASTSRNNETCAQPLIGLTPDSSTAGASQERSHDSSLATFRSWINNTASLCQRDGATLHPAVMTGLASFQRLSRTRPDVVAGWKATLAYDKSYSSHVTALGHYFHGLLERGIQVDRETQENFVLLSKLTTSTST